MRGAKEGGVFQGSHSSTMRKLLKRSGVYRVYLAISIVCAGCSVALTLAIPYFIGKAVDQVYVKGAGIEAMKLPALSIALCALGCGAFQWMINFSNNRIAFGLVRDMRNELLSTIERMPISYIDTHAHGDIVSRAIGDVEQLADGLLLGFTQLFTGVAMIAGTFFFMLSISVPITSVVLIITPFTFVAAGRIAKKTFHMFRQQSQARGEQTALVEETITNEKLVKMFGQERERQARFDEVNDRFARYSMKAVFYSSITNPTTRFINGLVFTGVGVLGCYMALSGVISVGQITSFLSYATQYTKPFNEISGVVAELQNAFACANRVFELIEAPVEEQSVGQDVKKKELRGEISFRDVSFSYTPDRPFIRNMSIHANPGEKIAIVGPTGCGKTTLINLLMRFYDVNEGAILIDGVDIRGMSREYLRSGFGMVLQDTWLRTGTVRENLKFGLPDATDEQMIEAAKAAYAHNFIMRLPGGYDTILSDGQTSLSQGQKQLLCIARIMLCNPPMLILDEATSSIDTRTEVRIQKAFDRLMRGKTSFVVAHRLSTIEKADQILVMRDGALVEKGNHRELLAKNGFYKTIYDAQFARS